MLRHEEGARRIGLHRGCRRKDAHEIAKRRLETRRFRVGRSEEHTSELQSLMRISYAVFCLKKKNKIEKNINILRDSVQTTHLITCNRDEHTDNKSMTP